MVNELEVPDAFAAISIHGNDTGAKEVVAWGMTTVVINGRRVGDRINDTGLDIRGQRSPWGYFTC